MDGIKHSRRFAELEALMGSYFRHHLVPVMTQTQSYLTEKQGEEMKAYSTSLGGILGRCEAVHSLQRVPQVCRQSFRDSALLACYDGYRRDIAEQRMLRLYFTAAAHT